MRLKQLYVKNFGKLNECTVVFQDGLNLVSGPNESGKTTLHLFIKSMLYGIRRMRGRAAQNDVYSRYEPWRNGNSYGGILWFESGGKTFRLRRSFHKSNPAGELVCETDGEKLSIECGDLKMLLGNVSETLFENTLLIGQLGSATGGNPVAALREYIVNYQESSGGGTDVDGALTTLRSIRRELERQIKEEDREIRIKIQELRNHLDYLDKERCGIEEKMAAADHKKISDSAEFRKKKGIPVAGMGAAALFLLSAFFWSSALPRAAFGAAAIGVAVGLVSVRHFFRMKKEEKEHADKIHRTLWNREQLEEMLEEKHTEIDNVNSELLELEEKSEECHPLQEEIQAVNLAMETIEEMSRHRQGEIGPALQRRTSRILRELTGGTYTGIHLSENLEIGIDVKDAYVRPEQLSRGTVEQIYFAFRMAAGEILCREEPLPILLDDVFVMYDEERLKRTLQWLSGCGRQVILFSCHSREERLMDALNIPYHKVNLEEM